MVDEKVQSIMELFEGSWAPEVIEDSEGINFDKPIKGKYICRIVELARRKGTSEKTGNPYDFFSLKLQVEQDVEGDASAKRYLDKTYFVGTSQYEDDPDGGIKTLFNDLFTADLLKDLTINSKDKYEVAEAIGPQLKDKLVNVSAWKTKAGNQAVKIVKEFKLNNKKESSATDDNW